MDWATGAALLVPATVAHEVGEWNEEFFLYSEETDYFRRIRDDRSADPIRTFGRGDTPRRWIRDIARARDPDGRQPCPLRRAISRPGILGAVARGGRTGAALRFL